MPWTVSFIQDTDAKGIGTATATDSDTGMTHSDRVDTSVAKDVSAFCTRAKELLAKHEADAIERQATIDKVFAELQK